MPEGEAMRSEHPQVEQKAVPEQNRVPNLLVWLGLAILCIPVMIDFYQGAVIMNNPPSLSSKRFLIFWFLIIPLLIALVLYSLFVIWTGKNPCDCWQY